MTSYPALVITENRPSLDAQISGIVEQHVRSRDTAITSSAQNIGYAACSEREMGVPDYRVHGMDPYSRAAYRLSTTMRSYEKMQERELLLRKSPELRRRIDTEPLREIVDFVDFKCHPQCSIARDQAIEGSDIDGGIVITAEPVDEPTQLRFAQAIRAQGFAATIPSEGAAFRTAAAEEPDFRASLSLILQATRCDLSEIRFYTTTEIEDMAQHNEHSPTYIYLAGYTIE